MHNLNNIFLFLGGLILLNTPAIAKDDLVISCGSSKGYAYYHEGGYVPAEKSGFTDDTISQGSIKVTLSDKGEWDVTQLDATQTQKSAREQGASIVKFGGNVDGITIIVNYPGSAHEIYVLRPLTNEIVWYRTTYDVKITKSSMYHAKCIY